MAQQQTTCDACQKLLTEDNTGLECMRCQECWEALCRNTFLHLIKADDETKTWCGRESAAANATDSTDEFSAAKHGCKLCNERWKNRQMIWERITRKNKCNTK